MRVLRTFVAGAFLFAASGAMAEDASPEPAVAPVPPVASAEPEQSAPAPVSAASPQPARPKVAEWIGQRLRVASMTPVMERPETDAAVTSHLRKGMEVEVVGLLDDPMWLQIALPDKSVGFVLTSAIPAATGAVPEKAEPPVVDASSALPGMSAALPPLPDQAPEPAVVEGAAMVFSTTVLTVNQNTYPLAEVDGFNGPERDGLEQFMHSKDDWVRCERAGSRTFVCKLRDGTDVAKAALVNGAARARPNAPHDYLVQQADAQAHGRGIWHAGREAVDAIPFSDGTGGRAIDPSDNYVPGVAYSGGQPIPAAFAAAAPSDGMAFVEQQPFTLVEGEPAPVVFEPGMGWGFWDRSLVWRRAPARWQDRLERRYPRGSGLRPVDLERHGLAPRDSFFRGPAMHLPPGAGVAAPFTRSPYAAVAFHPFPPVAAGGFPGHGGPMSNTGVMPLGAMQPGGPMRMPFQAPGSPLGVRPGLGGQAAMPLHGPMPGLPMRPGMEAVGRAMEPRSFAPRGAPAAMPFAPVHPMGMPSAPPPNVAAMFANRQAGLAPMAVPMGGRPGFAPPAMGMRPMTQAMPFINRGPSTPAAFVPRPMPVAMPHPAPVAAPRPPPPPRH